MSTKNYAQIEIFDEAEQESQEELGVPELIHIKSTEIEETSEQSDNFGNFIILISLISGIHGTVIFSKISILNCGFYFRLGLFSSIVLTCTAILTFASQKFKYSFSGKMKSILILLLFALADGFVYSSIRERKSEPDELIQCTARNGSIQIETFPLIFSTLFQGIQKILFAIYFSILAFQEQKRQPTNTIVIPVRVANMNCPVIWD